MNGSVADDSNGTASGQPDPKILQALEVIHNPRSKNEHRREASEYLEQLKTQDEAPYTGYILASNRSYVAVVRHFGLALLEAAIRHRWSDYGEGETKAVRDWCIRLAQSVEKEDPLFVRNKIAQLWVEVAKRSWALEWLDMDQLLVELWGGSVAKKVLVLEILETLSENSFGKEDTITALRGSDLSKACVEIFSPRKVMEENFPKRDGPDVRYGDEGWIWRITSFLRWCNDQGASDPDVVLCSGKSLAALKSVFGWAVLIAVAATETVQNVCRCLMSSNSSIQLAAIETLYALFYRINFSDSDIHHLVGPMYETSTINVLGELYQWSVCSANDIDDEKYLLCKKFSELMHNVGKFLRERPSALPQEADVPRMLDLLLRIAQNDSLHVSIPILHLFSQLLTFDASESLEPVVALNGPLLQFCSERLIRYELLPEKSTHPAILFLSEDVDTMPERHAFLGNYARFGKDIVEAIVKRQPYEALSHILGQADGVLRNPYSGEPPFDPRDHKKTSIAALKVDAQCSVIEAGLAGYLKWRTEERARENDTGTSNEQENINSNLEKWAIQLMEMSFEDPAIQQRVSGLIVEFAIGPLKRNAESMLRTFRYIISMKVKTLKGPETVDAALYHESVKDLQRFCSHQLQRIAMRASDYLIESYDSIAEAIGQCFSGSNADDEDKDKCAAVLFIIIQRTSKIEDVERARRLDSFVEPFMSKWSNASLAESLQSFPSFIDLLGLNGFQEYFLERKAHAIEDWSTVPLDEAGLALKARIEAAKAELPLRSTKTYFSVSLDRTEPGTRHYDAAVELWSKHILSVLPNLLQMVGLAHLFSEPSSWSHLPEESRVLPKRILRDRFWQVGISSGSRDEFYSRVEQTKTTLEGLASAIRGSLRFVRETSYRLICTMSLLGRSLYSFEELPGPLARAIFENSGALSTHQTQQIVDTMKPIIDHCPWDCREHFLTPVLTEMFNALDRKIQSEWESIDARNRAASVNDDLVEEMKDESILRNVTFNCITVVARLFDPNDGSAPLLADKSIDKTKTLRAFVLQNPQVFKSIILFCTHALAMHDGRACGLVTKVLRTIIPEFTKDDSISVEIREFISDEVFKACIQSLHDPYFVDIQNDLATLIATIITKYIELTRTPQQILLSLPTMTEEKLSAALYKLFKANDNSRQQRAIVLKLLEGVRGVSIAEQGKYPKPEKKPRRSSMAEKYLVVESKPDQPAREKSPDLHGIADMFA